jgi:cell wall-associated NlpC family hydrolase
MLTTALFVASSPALASATEVRASATATGGTTATSTTTSTGTGKTTGSAGSGEAVPSEAQVSGPHAPITGKARKLAKLFYKGHVYEAAGGSVIPYTPPQPTNTVMGATGGDPVGTAASVQPHLLVPGSTAVMLEEGLAAAPENAPKAVKEMIWAANEIVGKPYIYGGGHASFKAAGYDCSGTVSYALHGAELIETPMDSSEMEAWGEGGVGTWVTIFANPGHAYMTVAGLRLDTSPVEDPLGLEGPRWRPLRSENAGFVKRHPEGL